MIKIPCIGDEIQVPKYQNLNTTFLNYTVYNKKQSDILLKKIRHITKNHHLIMKGQQHIIKKHHLLMKELQHMMKKHHLLMKEPQCIMTKTPSYNKRTATGNI